jgi:hypothetical protein
MNARKSQKVLALGNEVSVSFCRFSMNQKERVEAYFCLEFFVTFCFKTKSLKRICLDFFGSCLS